MGERKVTAANLIALAIVALLILGCGWGLMWGWVETVRLTK